MIEITPGSPRKWWAAGPLSVILPGLGQVYNGQAKKGVLFGVALTFIVPVFLFLSLKLPFAPFNMAVPALSAFSFLAYIYVFFDASVTSRRRDIYTLKPYNRWYLYLGVIVVWTFGIQPASTYVIRSFLTQVYTVPAESMSPTLLTGDLFFADKLTCRFGPPDRGDIVVFELPEDEKRDFTKRVVGLPGERVEIQDKKVYIDGELLAEPYVHHLDKRTMPEGMSPRDNYGPTVVPPGHFFVLGDNRDDSYDSRFWGFVPAERIRGGAKPVIYWSWDSDAKRVRWERIGRVVR